MKYMHIIHYAIMCVNSQLYVTLEAMVKILFVGLLGLPSPTAAAAAAAVKMRRSMSPG